MVKGPFYFQVAANTQPTVPTGWSVGLFVDIFDPGDATSITIERTGVPSSQMPLHDEGTAWYLEVDYNTQAAMNAAFPSGTSYTLRLSGGTLGSLSQTLTMGSESYPNTPYLTGSSLTTAQNHQAANPLTVGWNDPGPLTRNSGVSVFEVFDNVDENSFFFLLQIGGGVGATVPAATLPAQKCLGGYLEFTNAARSPAGGFGIDGTVSHNVGTDFAIRTFTSPLASEVSRNGTPANPNALLPGLTSGPRIGRTWDPRIDHSSFVPDSTLDALVLALLPANLPSQFGTLLFNPGTLIVAIPAVPGTPFAVPVPRGCQRTVFGLVAQGLSVSSAGQISVTNAIDATFGY